MKERVEGAPVNMHVYLCEVTVGLTVEHHTLYCTGSLEVKLVEQNTLLDHYYQLKNAH